jgi:ABC-type antimicrobial peptide transport system permease subunit
MSSQPIRWFIKLAIARLRAQWRTILTIIIGVLLTTIIGASGPLYTSAIAQVGLEQRLSQQSHEAVNIFMRLGIRGDVEDFTTDRTDYDRVIHETIAQTLSNFNRWRDKTVTWAESVTLNVMRDGDDLPNVLLRLAHYDHLTEYTDVVAGTWMSDASLPQGIDVEIALSEPIAEVLSVTIGDVLVLEQRGWDSSLPITAQVSTIFIPQDALGNYWMSPSPLRLERRGAEIQANIFVTRADFDRLIPDFIPQTRAQIGWRVLFNHHLLPYDQLPEAQTVIRSLENNISSALQDHTGERVQVIYETDLGNALGAYGGEVKRLGAPFTLFLVQLGALVLFFLVVMGELVRRNERREIGMMKARGVRDSQLLFLRGMETFIICLISVLIAPFIARQLLIGLIPLFTPVESIPLEIRLDAFLYATGAGIVAWVVLVATLIPLLRTPLILSAGIADRAPSAAWWQRYYLDVILLIVGLVAFSQLNSGRTPTDGENPLLSDPLLLLMPTLLIFAIGSVSLRLFPVFVNAVANLLGQRSGLAGALAGWQVSREPAHYGRMTFLLALAISMGWFALSFQQTVTISQSDRALYYVGSDLRLTYEGDKKETEQTLQAFEGVQAVSTITRYENISTSRGTLNLNMAQVLGVDSQSLNETVYWRPEWGNITLDDTYQPAVNGESLPIIPQKITMWGLFHTMATNFDGETVLNNNPFLGVSSNLTLTLNDEGGQVFTLPLIPPNPTTINYYDEDGELVDPATIRDPSVIKSTEMPNEGWNFFEADLTPIIEKVQGNLQLQSIVIEESRDYSRSTFVHSVYLRDLVLVTDDEPIALDWFTSHEWDFIAIANVEPALPFIDEITDSELMDKSLQVYWQSGLGQAVFATSLNYVPPYTVTLNNATSPNDADIVGIPALISQSMAEQRNITEGQNFEMLFNNYSLWFQAVAINDYFPTLYNNQAPFVVVDADRLNAVLTYVNGGIPQQDKQEIWVRTDTPASIESVLNDLALIPDDRFVITDSLRSDIIKNNFQTDLLAVGLIGLLIFSAIIGFLLSLVGLLTYASLAVQARRTEFAVLRAMGFGTPRIILSMAIEQTFVIIISIVLGMLIGLFISTQILPVLSVDTTGNQLVPPFYIQIDLWQMMLYIGGILLILMLQLVISSLLVSRLTTTQALRQPNE